MIRQAEISTRNQFGELLERREAKRGVEVGTHLGEFANILLKRWPSGYLTCIDPWANTTEAYKPQEKLLWGGNDRNEHFHTFCDMVVGRYPTRVRALVGTSELCVNQFADHSLDFVYIDGDHRYEEVFKDLQRWYPKLKPGGMLAGHDFIQPGEKHNWADQVQRAVLEFYTRLYATSNGKADLYLVVEEDGLPWSFWMEWK